MNHFSFPRFSGHAALSATAAAALAFGLAAPAAADPTETYEGAVRAQYVDKVQSGESVTMTGGTIGTSLFRLDMENNEGSLPAYCIDFETNILGGAWYLEDDWANYPGQGEFAEPGKVHWLLQNGYPSAGTEELAEAAGAEGATDAEALGATQAAIWHFSNDEDLSGDQGNITAIYDHLVASAEPLPQDEPEATLSVSPDSATGQAGETVGEFTVSTNAEQVPVDLSAPEGVELVDLESGEAVDAVANGSTVGFSVPEDAEPGEASFSLETSSTVDQGRLFKGEDANEPTQTLITAEDSTVDVSASAGVEWSEAEEPAPEPEPEEPTEEPEPDEPTEEPGDDKPAPEDDKDEPELPVTGGALAGLVAAGVAALGAGGGALYLSRKRKAGAGDEEMDA